jgi:hypothetical protein
MNCEWEVTEIVLGKIYLTTLGYCKVRAIGVLTDYKVFR